MAIRKPNENRDVPLPTKWENFTVCKENKTDLACLLSEQLILGAPSNKTIVAAGGFGDK